MQLSLKLLVTSLSAMTFKSLPNPGIFRIASFKIKIQWIENEFKKKILDTLNINRKIIGERINEAKKDEMCDPAKLTGLAANAAAKRTNAGSTKKYKSLRQGT